MENKIEAIDDLGNKILLTVAKASKDLLGLDFNVSDEEGRRGFAYVDQNQQERVVLPQGNFKLPENWRPGL